MKPDFIESPAIVAAALRNKISPTALVNIMMALIESCQGDSSKVNLSYAQFQRKFTKQSHQLAEEICESWEPPELALIQWDGKLINTLDGSDKTERLPVILSGSGTSKLLGVPYLERPLGYPIR